MILSENRFALFGNHFLGSPPDGACAALYSPDIDKPPVDDGSPALEWCTGCMGGAGQRSAPFRESAETSLRDECPVLQ
jgi:hypothetical protein